MMTRGLIAVCAVFLISSPVWAHHRPGHNPPGLNKMPAPEGVTCTPGDTGVVVDFGVLEGAGGYQVEYTCLDAGGLPVEESVFIEAPPTADVPPECEVVLSVHVRATPTLGPVGMKGHWSDDVSCVVVPE